MPKNRAKAKKSVVKSPRSKSRKSKPSKTKSSLKTTRPVKNTYNEWISKQIKRQSGRKEVKKENPSELPRDTFNEWLKNQRVSETTERKTMVEIPKTTYELWMARQISERGESSAVTESIGSGGSSEVVSVSRDTNSLASSLPGENEIRISVIGRKSGNKISTPVWFVYDEANGEGLLMPVRGTSTNWFKNLQAKRTLGIEVGGRSYEVDATPEPDAEGAQEVAEKFRAKYGEGDVRRFYPKINAFVRFTAK